MAIDKDQRDLEQIDFDIKDMVNILDQVEIKEKRAPLPNKRNLILDEIKDTIECGDKDRLENIFKENKDFNINTTRHDYKKILFDNFNKDIAIILKEKGMFVDFSDCCEVLKTKKTFTDIDRQILDFMLILSESSHKYMDSQPDNKEEHLKRLSDFERIAHEYNKETNPSYNLLYNSTHFLINGQIKKNQQVINYLESKDENFVKSLFFINHPNVLFNFLANTPSQDNAWHKHILSKVPEQMWGAFFEEKFDVDNFQNLLSVDRILFFTNYLNENKNILNAWNDFQKDRKKYYKEWLQWSDKMLPDNLEFKDTPIYKMTEGMSVSYWGGKNIKFQDYLNDLILNFFNNTPNIRASDIFKYKTVSQSTFLKILAPHVLKGSHLKEFIKNSDLEDIFFKKYKSPSFIHMLVEENHPILELMVKKEKGRQAIERALENPYTKLLFLSKASNQSFISILKAIPSLKDYRDDNNNNLGMIYATLRELKSKTTILSLHSLSPQWFEDVNSDGYDFVDVLKSSGANASTLAALDSKMIKHSLKEGVSGVKLRSRTKHSSTRKKM